MRPHDYISRAIDADCLRALRAGRNFCVFGPPQTGKTRLRRRVAGTLRASGLRVAEIDLGRRGGGELFFGVAVACAVPFGLGDPAIFWDRFADLEPAERLQRFLQSAPAGAPVVLLVDRVEALLSGGHDVEAFFSALRPAGSVGRTPLITCLFGTVERIDLGVDIRTATLGRSHTRAWFRTAVQLRPAPFTIDELDGVLHRLEAPGGDPRALLDGIMAWTAGHPALTTALIEAIADGGPLMISGSEADTVAATVDALFVDAPDPVPAFVAAEAWTDCADPAATARIWRRIREGQAVDWRPGDEAHRHLRMAGLVRVEGATLRPSNRVFVAAFDDRWCDARTFGHGLTARARAWIAHGRSPEDLLIGDLLRRASAWSEGRDVELAVVELIASSWVQARRRERTMAPHPEPLRRSPPRVIAPSVPPISMTEATPPARIASAPPPAVPIRETVRPRAAPTPRAVQVAAVPSMALVYGLAAAIIVMGLVTVTLLAVLLDSRGGVERALATLRITPAPMAAETGAASQPGGSTHANASSTVGSAAPMVMASAAPAPAVAAAAEAEPVVERHAPDRSGSVKGRESREAARSEQVAREVAAVAQRRAEQRVQRRAEQRAQRRAEQRAQRRAEQRAQRRAEQRAQRRAEQRAQRRAQQRARRRAEQRAQRRAEERARRRAAEAAERSRRAAAEEAARPGPIPAPAPAAAITRQAPGYRRALVRCKHMDTPLAVRLTLTVNPDGRVAEAAVARGEAGRVDHACLVEGARRFRFAPFAGSPVVTAVDYRL